MDSIKDTFKFDEQNAHLVSMYSLCIVESPAKCGKIQGFLGPGWKVVATMGHIRALEEDLDAIGINRDFQARYTFIKEKGKAMSAIRDAAKGASTIYLAADDDREGEAIAYSVAVLLNLDVAKTPRAIFHEITKQAVTKAVAQPRRLDMNRVEAQQSRAILDMMVGFTISPLLWKHVGPALSAGRCQTPALRLLVDREREITNFQTQMSWRISGNWTATALPFQASLVDELDAEEDAMNFLENLHDDTRGTILATKTQPRTESPPKPLITSTLQQEASALFSFPPKTTMKAAQTLYEQGHITYMRTDSTYMSDEAVKDARDYVTKTYGEEYLTAAGQKYKKAEGAQEAHEAIRPTHMEVLVPDGNFSGVELRVYKLIWQRAIQSIMAPAKSEEHIVIFKALADPGEFNWQAVWKRSVFPGWKKVGLAAVVLDDEEEAEADAATATWAAATKLKVGDTVNWTSLAANPHETKATGRYTEATLVRELERKGIGRPSTFASLVGTVLEKEYAKKEDKPAVEISVTSYHIEKVKQWPPTRQIQKKKVGAEKQKLTPTDLGISVHDFCIKEFPALFDYGFTKKMEDRLDLVAQGSEPWKNLCRDTWNSYKDKLTDLKKAPSMKPGEKMFGEIKAIQSKKGPLLLIEKEGDSTKFLGWPEGVSFASITQEQVTEFIEGKGRTDVFGTLEDKPIVKKKGPYGFYVQWGDTKLPLAPEDTLETVKTKLLAKGQSILHTLGPYEFRRGPYGAYMFKKVKGKEKVKFVSLPDALDPRVLTEEAAAKIYSVGASRKK
jgi:DNA topoisomerase-1